MGFKIGDKVRLINYFETGLNGSIGFISEVRKPGICFPYRVDFRSSLPHSFWLPVRADEIEKVSTKGQQLLFSFMT